MFIFNYISRFPLSFIEYDMGNLIANLLSSSFSDITSFYRYDGSIGSASHAMGAVDRFVWLLCRKNLWCLTTFICFYFILFFISCSTRTRLIVNKLGCGLINKIEWLKRFFFCSNIWVFCVNQPIIDAFILGILCESMDLENFYFFPAFVELTDSKSFMRLCSIFSFSRFRSVSVGNRACVMFLIDLGMTWYTWR